MESFNNNLQGGKLSSRSRRIPGAAQCRRRRPSSRRARRCAARPPRRQPPTTTPTPPRAADAAPNSLLQADAPGLMVGSGLASQTQRVIKPVEA